MTVVRRPEMTPAGGSPPESRPVADNNIRIVAQIEQEAAERRTAAQRFSDRVLALASRDATIVWHIAVFTIWIAVNAGLFQIQPFDPYPFSLLTIAVSLEVIILTLFVLSGQHRLRQEADRRAHLDLQVNLLAEQEMTVVLQMLKEICEHLDLRGTIDSRKFIELVKHTDVSELADRLERTMGADDTPKENPPPRDAP
jgi:uncharacterized membrane protein